MDLKAWLRCTVSIISILSNLKPAQLTLNFYSDPANGNQECFDETSLICDDCFTVDCGDRPVCDANDQNCDDDEGFVCPEPTGLWEDPESCCHWYQCEEGRAFHMDCPYCK